MNTAHNHNTHLAFIGLGRMGLAMVTLLQEKGFQVHGFNRSEEPRREAEAVGVSTYESAAATVESLPDGPRTVWLMVPAIAVDDVLAEIIPVLKAGDTVIDGGNTFFKDSLRRHEKLAQKEINFIDVGTSGGVEGARHGTSLMVGGKDEVVQAHTHIFTALAKANAYGHVGGPGAGHYVKMIHNGIEYGMMGALAEGMNVIETHAAEFDIKMDGVLNAYENGSIISSSLMSWLADSYRTEGYLEAIAGEVPRGETEEEMEHIVGTEDVAILKAALNQRVVTRTKPSRIGTLISAMRNQFGGHKTIHRD